MTSLRRSQVVEAWAARAQQPNWSRAALRWSLAHRTGAERPGRSETVVGDARPPVGPARELARNTRVLVLGSRRRARRAGFGTAIDRAVGVTVHRDAWPGDLGARHPCPLRARHRLGRVGERGPRVNRAV